MNIILFVFLIILFICIFQKNNKLENFKSYAIGMFNIPFSTINIKEDK